MAKIPPDMPDPEMPTTAKPMSLARKAGIFTLSRAVTLLTQFVVSVVLAHSLSEADLGVVTYLVLTLYGTALTFGQIGLPDSVFYFFEKTPHAQRRSLVLLFAKTLAWLSLAAAAVMVAVALLGATRPGFGEVRTLVWAMVAVLAFELPTMVVPNLLIATDRAKDAAWFNIFTGLAQLAATTLPLLLPDPVAVIPLGLLCYAALKLGVSGLLFRRVFGGGAVGAAEPLPKGTLRQVLSYAVPLSLAQIFWSLNRQVDKQVVQWFLPAAFAVYSYGAMEIPFIPTIAYSVSAVMMPQLVALHLRGDREALLRLWMDSIRKLSAIVLPLVMVFVVGAEEFIRLLFPGHFDAAVLPFRIYTMILLMRVASYSGMQRALGSTGKITRSAIYLFLLNAALSVPLVHLMGTAGPPVAAWLANLALWWYALDDIRSKLNARLTDVFPFGAYLRSLAVAAAAAVPAFLLKAFVKMPDAVGFFALTAVYLPCYLLLARATGIIADEDWRRLWRR